MSLHVIVLLNLKIMFLYFVHVPRNGELRSGTSVLACCFFAQQDRAKCVSCGGIDSAGVRNDSEG